MENTKYDPLTAVTRSSTQEDISSAHRYYFCKGVFPVPPYVLMEKFLPKPVSF